MSYDHEPDLRTPEEVEADLRAEIARLQDLINDHHTSHVLPHYAPAKSARCASQKPRASTGT